LFNTLLVANRGEIALRVVRACRELGVRAVAVFSEADRLAPHVLEADEAVLLGPAPSSESYLRIDRILAAARATGADAIHPGYGFLSEREVFARAVQDAGFIFVGPRPETLAAMGDKTEARRRMRAAGVPIVPGLVDPVSDAQAARDAAREIGLPVLLKAAAGGGGKGMRVVTDESQLARSFEAASREALGAFGDGAIYLERYLERPRHIEVQVFGDTHGRVVHLGERECSIQRRHQKLVEEAPSPALTPEQRGAIGDAAVRAAAAVQYVGAGTCEFLYDEENAQFYFLEMNTRIQVEHPVTELVTGIDLVQWQIRVAAGERFAHAQDEIRLVGHAIECRITAEDPEHGFLPSTGTVEVLAVPGGPGVRWDGGIVQGSRVTLHYDPLLAKLVVHAPTRLEAVERMARALDELVIGGVETSASFHRRVMRESDFRDGRLSIRYLEDHPALAQSASEPGLTQAAAVAAALLEDAARSRPAAARPAAAAGAAANALSPWRAAGWPWTAKPLRPTRRP
jgi:acetyl-CoA carboxylase biotin carboxylase subunit